MDSLEQRMDSLEQQVDSNANRLKRLELLIENDILTELKLLSDSYLPSAKRYEKSTEDIEALQTDVTLLKKVVAEHRETLQRIS